MVINNKRALYKGVGMNEEMEERTNELEEIYKQISEIEEVSAALKERILNDLQQAMPLYLPITEYATLKKVILELLRLKTKIMNRPQSKEEHNKVLEYLQKINY